MLSLENVLSLQWSGRSNPGSFCEANLAETRFNFLLFYWSNGDSCDVMIILKCIVTFEALSHRTPLKVCLICAMGIHQKYSCTYEAYVGPILSGSSVVQGLKCVESSMESKGAVSTPHCHSKKTFYISHLLIQHAVIQQPIAASFLFEEDAFICCLVPIIPETAPYVESSSMCSCVLHNIVTFIQTSHTTIYTYG